MHSRYETQRVRRATLVRVYYMQRSRKSSATHTGIVNPRRRVYTCIPCGISREISSKCAGGGGRQEVIKAGDLLKLADSPENKAARLDTFLLSFRPSVIYMCSPARRMGSILFSLLLSRSWSRAPAWDFTIDFFLYPHPAPVSWHRMRAGALCCAWMFTR